MAIDKWIAHYILRVEVKQLITNQGDETMEITNKRDEVLKQRVILEKEYNDYDPRYHDAFVLRYRRGTEDKALRDFWAKRGIK